MPTATTKPAPAHASHVKSNEPRGDSAMLRAFDAVYHFLASLKLAVFSISCLAAVLAYATFFESWYGTGAVQQWIYQSPGFAVLLAFLGTNILCAALIRYPWTKRQTGFVITHAGLLVVLAGSWISFKFTDDGQVGMVEGDDSSQLVRIDHSALRVQAMDAATGRADKEYQLPFHPGAFSWENDKQAAPAAEVPAGLAGFAHGASVLSGLALAAFLAVWVSTGARRIRPAAGGALAAGLAVLGLLSLHAARTYDGPRIDVLTDDREPFEVKVKEFYAASSPPKFTPKAGKDGVPMIKATLLVKPPRAERAIDVLADPGRDAKRWLVADYPRLRRAARNAGPALLTFQYVESEDQVADFLELPKDPLKDDQARIHYQDKDGRARVYTWPIDDQAGKSVVLPDSDLTVTYEERKEIPLGHEGGPSASMMRAVGEPEIHSVVFRVKKGAGPEIAHHGWASLPMIPSVIPSADAPAAEARELVHIGYYHPPHISQVALQGRSGVIDILGTPDGRLYYRAFGREGLRGKGSLKLGTLVKLVSGPNQPVAVSLQVDAYLTSGVDHETCLPLVLPKGQMDKGIPACLVEMTVKGETRELWLRRAADFRQEWQDVTFPSGTYRVAFDFDRKPLDFTVKLIEFDEGKDPGSSQSKSFKSDVLLTDASQRIENKPITISMNRPMSHRHYTFYQSNFIHMLDQSGRRTGEVMSVFQVRYDPVWGIIYGGCLLVVLGIFVQFYMRAGVFTDGGKRERARAAAKAAATARRNGQPAPAASSASIAAEQATADFEEL